MLKRIKERLLGDDRAAVAVAEIKSLYEAAEDPEAFNNALKEGDFKTAAEYHPLSADELEERFGDLQGLGENVAEDYPDVIDSSREDFIKA